MEKKRRREVNGELGESDGEFGDGEDEIVLVVVLLMRFMVLCDMNLRILKKKGAIKR